MTSERAVEPEPDPPPQKRGTGCAWLAAVLVIVLASSIVPAPSEAPEPPSTARTLRGAPLVEVTGRASTGISYPVASSRETGDKGPKGPLSVAALEETRQASPAEFDLATGSGKLDGGAPQLSGEALSFVVAAPALRHGVLSYVDAKYGPDYLALPEPRGTVARICGPADCVTRRSTDYGPDQRVHPDRIADLSAADFVHVCGVPLSAGLCKGTVELEPPVDPADDAARVEDGGPRPTLPATSTEDVP